MDLQKKIAELSSRIGGLEVTVDVLTQENKALKIMVKNLWEDNTLLKEKLHKKNSNNSSVPPSKDENRAKKNQSLRKPSGLKSGGQKGHKGSTLEMCQNPDIVLEHKPSFCTCCGELFTGTSKLSGRRQSIDIPPIKPIVTEHRIFTSTCKCGYISKSDYPKEVSSPISYGNNIEVLINYLSVRQYIPIERIQEFLQQIAGIRISQGTIVNKLQSFKEKSIKTYNQIQSRVESSSVVGADETGCVVNGDKHWMWTWQTPSLTYIAVSETRGYKAVEDNFQNGFPNAVLVSDCWAAQLKTVSKKHQICLAHLQRELNYFIELAKEKWSTAFLQIIKTAIGLKKKILQNPKINYDDQIKSIIDKGNKLIAKKTTGPKNLLTLKRRLEKRKNNLWVFLQHLEVPPDNNASERAIRNVKVKQKVSGQFKTFEGAQHFAVVRSVIDTIIKNKNDISLALNQIATLVPE
jgi:transposase